jgi:hypothetical protein
MIVHEQYSRRKSPAGWISAPLSVTSMVVGPEGEFHTAIRVELFKTEQLALYDPGNKVLVRAQGCAWGFPSAIPAKSAAKSARAPDGRHRLCAGDENRLNRLQ